MNMLKRARQITDAPIRMGRAGITALVLAALVIAWITWLVYEDRYQARMTPVNEQQEAVVTDLIQQLGQTISHLSELTFLLRHEEGVVRALPTEGPIRISHLHDRFALFSKSSSLISQVRWLDNQGMERARINIRDQQPVAVPAKELQNKGDRYYIRQARDLGPDEVFYSRIDLNMENGRIQQPRTPTLRTVIRTGDQGKMRAGFLVVNFDLSRLFADVRNMASTSVNVSLVNRQGYWLLHPDPSLEWGFMTGHTGLNVAGQLPELWQQMTTQPAGYGLQLNGALWSYARFLPRYAQTTAAQGLGEIFVVLQTPAQTLAGVKRQVLAPVVIVAVVIYLLLAVGLYLYLRGDQTRKALLAELRREEQELRTTNRELKASLERQQALQDELVETRKLSSLGLMVAGVAHELNTPTGGTQVALTTMDAQLEKLSGKVEAGTLTVDDMQEFLQREREGLDLAKRNTRRTAELIRSFKRLAIDRQQSEPSWFNLKHCMNDLDQALIPQFKNASQTLSFSVPDVEMFGLPGILSQVMQNLIENALSHAFEEGQSGSISVIAREQGNRILISVQDDGAGLAPGAEDKLFDPFFTTGRKQGNTGLGLHLVHQWVVQALKGSIRFHSIQGEGTRFDIVIPRTLNDGRNGADTPSEKL
ncbi:sensor histidine kinase [Marinobacter oulmenensis]|uniref:histidine kinase n=1 Tax=Marinobacter oulmenensis TaxID=643747 RepID=A0A840U4Y0_9GAMM|nr:HAMP domain-containing sensor histidine kinase [Marinobacter oulmenensis]MBB5320784.1 signal transduction histidine kinase [Marinobacter oulmenensis]